MLQTEDKADTRGKRELLIESSYTGLNKQIDGTQGEAYFRNEQWFYRPKGKVEWWRVQARSLSCNSDNGKMNAEYIGTTLNIPKTGKAWFDETQNSWIYRGDKKNKDFRVQETSLKFIRDEDVFDGTGE